MTDQISKMTDTEKIETYKKQIKDIIPELKSHIYYIEKYNNEIETLNPKINNISKYDLDIDVHGKIDGYESELKGHDMQAQALTLVKKHLEEKIELLQHKIDQNDLIKELTDRNNCQNVQIEHFNELINAYKNQIEEYKVQNRMYKDQIEAYKIHFEDYNNQNQQNDQNDQNEQNEQNEIMD